MADIMRELLESSLFEAAAMGNSIYSSFRNDKFVVTYINDKRNMFTELFICTLCVKMYWLCAVYIAETNYSKLEIEQRILNRQILHYEGESDKFVCLMTRSLVDLILSQVCEYIIVESCFVSAHYLVKLSGSGYN